MAKVRSFRGIRYNPQRIKTQDVVTQPYDKITPSMQKDYYERSDYNIVRVILPYEDPDKYRKAGEFLKNWYQNGVLTQDNKPCMYPYHQEFTDPGTKEKKTRKGFCAVLRVEDFSTGVVLPHERTLSKPKEDRLNLLRATQTHLGQTNNLKDSFDRSRRVL